MGRPSDPPPASRRVRLVWLGLRLFLLVLLVFGIHLLVDWFLARTAEIHPGVQISMLVGVLLVYALLIAIPFVPGIEIGLMMFAALGSWIAPWIYLASIAGLFIAYSAGEWMPYGRLRRMFEDLRMRRAADLLAKMHQMTREEQVSMLCERAPRWLRPVISQYRYLFLAALINLPGNAIIGGGGGILFLAGLSRLFRPFGVALTLALAVLPVPLAVWGFGLSLLP